MFICSVTLRQMCTVRTYAMFCISSSVIIEARDHIVPAVVHRLLQERKHHSILIL